MKGRSHLLTPRPLLPLNKLRGNRVPVQYEPNYYYRYEKENYQQNFFHDISLIYDQLLKQLRQLWFSMAYITL